MFFFKYGWMGGRSFYVYLKYGLMGDNCSLTTKRMGTGEVWYFLFFYFGESVVNLFWFVF